MAALAPIYVTTSVVAASRTSRRPALSVRAVPPEAMQMHEEKPHLELGNLKSNLHCESAQGFGRAALTAAVAVTLMFADPAIAFKGGGPYGQEVTRGLDLSGRDFSGKTLIKQDFKASNLRQTSFKGAKLLGASFFDANLTGSDLTDADLRGADLSLTNATKANFTNANLEGALVTGNTSFKGAVITGADFTDVLFRDDQRTYLCSIADGVNPVTGNATRNTLGC